MNLEQQVAELEKALQTLTEAHHTALEVERAKVRELEAKIDTITTDVNYEGGVQFWIKKHDSLAISMAELVNKYGELEAQLAKSGAISKEDSLDCGKGWLSPDEAKALQDRLAKYEKQWNDMNFTICKLEQDLRKAKGEQ